MQKIQDQRNAQPQSAADMTVRQFMHQARRSSFSHSSQVRGDLQQLLLTIQQLTLRAMIHDELLV